MPVGPLSPQWNDIGIDRVARAESSLPNGAAERTVAPAAFMMCGATVSGCMNFGTSVIVSRAAGLIDLVGGDGA